MPTNRSNTDKLHKLVMAWEVHAPNKSFGGMTLPEFKTKVQPSLDARDALESAVNSRRDAALRRDDFDVESIRAQQMVISSIKGDPEHGDDSPLYQASGYVPRSQQKSGLSRKTKTAQVQQKAA